MQTERDEMEYYGYTQRWVILCKDCKRHGTCRYEQHLGLDGYCSKAERKDVLLEADLTSEQKAYLKGYADGMTEPKHGRWIDMEYKDEWYGEILKCSLCGYKTMLEDQHNNYCENCGARMDAQIGEDPSHPFAESVMMGMRNEVDE